MSRLGSLRSGRAMRRRDQDFRRAMREASPSLRRELEAIWLQQQDAR